MCATMNLNIQLLSHVGIELVVISGLTFWLNNRISKLSERQYLTDEKLKKIEEILNVYGKAIESHERILRGGGRPPPTPQPNPPPSRARPKHRRPPSEPRKPAKPAQPPMEEQYEEPQEDENGDAAPEEQIDDLLSDELEQIQAERDASADEVEVEQPTHFKKTSTGR